MRVVESPDGLDEAIAAAQREATAGFGDDRVFIERFLPRARHIEVQVIGDTHGTVLSLGERECSLQRRHQKVLEESPSPVVSPELRARLGEEAIALAKAAGYHGAGTVEFIADADDPSTHFFLEMNARLQVEHPVTELVTGLDLVELQLRVAAGEALERRADDRPATRSRRASTPRTRASSRPPARCWPARYPRGVRVDAAVETGSVVGTDYDSMIAKVIAHGPDRATALARLDRALADTAILGLTTNTGLPAHAARARGRARGGDGHRPDRPPRARARRRSSDEQVARAAAAIALKVAPRRATTRSTAATAGASAASARRRTGRCAVDGGEPLDVVLSDGGRARRATFPWPAGASRRRDGGGLARPRGLDVARDRGHGRGRPPRARRRRAARADARRRAADADAAWATRSRPARPSWCWSR